MASVNSRLSVQPNKVLRIPRIVTLLGSILVALSSGTNYVYSAYGPQLGARLRVSHTQLNIIGLAGNTGAYTSAPVWGRIVDRKGPRILLISASTCLFVGYWGIKQMYDDGMGNGTTVSPLRFSLLVVCSFMTGSGGSAGLNAAVNATAKSFPSSVRATTTSLVISFFGLSAFWFSLIANTLFPGDISAFLTILALGTAIPMLIGVFVVKPVPLHPTSSHPLAEGYDSIPSGDNFVFVGEAQAALDTEANVEEEAYSDSAPLLSHEQESMSLHHERSVEGKDGLPDIHGKRLWATPDFYLVLVIVGMCSGTGLMYINNVGSISQALYANTHTVYDDVEASKWQAAQVSFLSLGNFAGRALIGLISDFAHTRLRLPRAYCLCFVSSLFIISQATAIIVSSVETLWLATLLLGLAYGSLLGSIPAILIEWFGLAHFSENWGYTCFSPLVWGNLFSLMFGRNLDAHAPTKDTNSSFGTAVWSFVSLAVTLVACIVSHGLSWWAGVRDGQKVKARNASVRG